MKPSIVYYSVNTKIAHEINERYYKGIHYVWCCPFFFKEQHPVSSTPRKIYNGLVDDVRSKDRHSSKIRDNIAGILTGAVYKLRAGVINQRQYDEIKYRVTDGWERADFMPLIFVIPKTAKVNALIKWVPPEERASSDSEEFKIESLSSRYFDVITMYE